MKVGLITTWKVKCGIAEYSRNLMMSLEKLQVEVLIYPIARIWDLRMFSPLEKHNVINFQYEHGILSQVHLHKWVKNFHSLAKRPKLFITVHQVLKDDLWQGFYNFIDGVIVHLEHFGPVLRDKTYVIPHGCPVYESRSRQEARKKLGWDKTGPILSTFGFMFPHKNWEFIIGAMPEIQKKHPECILLMLCSHFRDKSKTKPTEKAMKEYAKKIGANVKLFTDKWDINEFMPMIQASDIFITSQETQDRIMASGSAMMGISARRPTITNDCSIYNQVKPYSYAVPRGRPDKIAEAVLNLLSDERLYTAHLRKIIEAYSMFNWDAVAQRHMALYKAI